MTTKKKKSAREKRVLVASLIIAATIVAGSTFAWFTSTDEVTNRLSASANYGVSIAEDFTPPEDWVPGQVINKDVGAVNTGNVDAFVRMWLEGEMSVFKRTTQNNSVGMPSANPTALTKTTDKKYLDLGFNYVDTNNNYYKELSQLQRENNSNNASAAHNEDTNIPAQFSEVQAMQAGGYLAYVPDNAEYYYVVEQATTIKAFADTNNATPETTINLKKGDIVATKGATIPTLAAGQTAAYIAKGTKGISIDTSEFYPQTEGVYLFRRSVDLNSEANTADDYEYSGYYYVPATGGKLIETSSTGDDNTQHYLALYTDRVGNDSDKSDYTIPDDSIETTATTSPSNDVISVTPSNNLKFFNAKENVVENSALTWAYDNTAGKEKLTATYNGGTTDSTADDISVDINLANIGTDAEMWTALGEPKFKTFYYNNDVEEGDTTTKLVDSVKLADSTTQDAYLAFDFDLNVFMDSVQVTKNEEGVEGVDSVNPWNGIPTNQTAYGAATNADEEITKITWTTNAP